MKRLFMLCVALSVAVLSAACSQAGSPERELLLHPPSPSVVPDPAPEEPPQSVAAAAWLDERAGPRRETSGSVPHVQLDSSPDPDVDAELRRRAYLLPGVEQRESSVSLPGAAGLWIAQDVELQRGGVLRGDREFGHIHPDGSLHLWLPIELAQRVDQAKWGELHPWVDRDGFWDGVVMVYTPETPDELEVTIRLIVEAYNFVTGADVDPSDAI